MATGQSFYNKLTKAQKEKFDKNLAKQFRKESWIKKNFDSLYDFIIQAFIWEHTEEGKDYWQKIADSEKTKNY